MRRPLRQCLMESAWETVTALSSHPDKIEQDADGAVLIV